MRKGFSPLFMKLAAVSGFLCTLLFFADFIKKPADGPKLQEATFAEGCFWHTEEIFLELKGVKDAVPGYCGGHIADPTYKDVSTGKSGHAEVVEVFFDPTVITYKQLLEVFFGTHDPTSLNKQGPDVGSQYRSAIFYHTNEQQRQAEDFVAKLDRSGKYNKSIVTQIMPYTGFYKAEDEHIRYFRHHPNDPYIMTVTMPLVEKFRRDFKPLLKEGSKGS